MMSLPKAPPSETAQGLKSLAAHSFIEKNRQFFTYETCFTHCTVLQQHNEDAMMSLPKAPQNLQRNIRWEICILGLFQTKEPLNHFLRKAKPPQNLQRNIRWEICIL